MSGSELMAFRSGADPFGTLLKFRPDIMKVGRSCRMGETNQEQEAQDGKDGRGKKFCGD